MIMTEKEKCALGLLYDPDDKELSAERCFCRDLCFAYNHTSPSQLERLRDMMRQLLGKTPSKSMCLSGATMAITLRWVKTFLPTTI